MVGLLDSILGRTQQPQAQTSMSQPQQGGLFSGRLGVLNDPSVALPLAGALMQPGNLGANLGQGFALAGEGIQARKKLQQEQLQQNMTAKYLEAQGADPSLVELAKSGAGAQALQMWNTTREKPLDELRLKTAQLQYEKLKNGDAEKFFGNVQYGKDANGKDIAFQVGESGHVKQLELPEGTTLAPPGLQKVDLGTKWGFVDRAGNLVASEPKDVAGEASQKVQGTAQGEAQFALPAAKLSVDTAIQQAEQLQNDRYLPSMVGPKNSRLPNVTADAARVQGMMNQLGGSAFLQARQALKGGGAITDMEGQKAEEALVRANAAQNIEDYKAAIEEYKTHLRNGYAILEQQARGGGAAQPAAPQGVTGTTSTNVPFRVVQ